MNLREIQREFNINLKSISDTVSSQSEKGLARALKKIKLPLISPFLRLEELSDEKLLISFGKKNVFLASKTTAEGALLAGTLEGFKLLADQHGRYFSFRPLSVHANYDILPEAPLLLYGELPYLAFESFLSQLKETPTLFEWTATPKDSSQIQVGEITIKYEFELKNKHKKLGL